MLAEMGGGSGGSSPTGRDMLRCGAGDTRKLACVKTARLPSIYAMRGVEIRESYAYKTCACPVEADER